MEAAAFKNVRGFEANLLLSCEESEVCRRILKQAKKEAYLEPNLEFINYESASISSNSVDMVRPPLLVRQTLWYILIGSLPTSVLELNQGKITTFTKIRKSIGKILENYGTCHYA